MTVIAAFLLGGFPIVIGDMLISGPELTDTQVGIPTVDDEITDVFPAGSGYSIVGMQQKVFILSEDLAVAWAGNLVAAKTLITELSSLARAGPITVASINSFARNDAPAICGDLNASLVGAFSDSDGIRLFGYNAQNIAVPGFQDVMIAGTGADAVTKLLSDLPPSLEVIRGTTHALSEAVCKTLILTGVLLSLEIGNRESLRTFYGGGYELASRIGHRFSKIDDVTYVFWYAEIRSDGVRLNLPHTYLKFAYKDDALLIRSFHTKPEPGTGRRILDDRLHIYPNFLSPTRQWSISDRPTMNSRFVCSYIVVDNPPQPFEILCHVDFEPTGSRIFTFDDSGEKPSALFERSFIDLLIKWITEHLKKTS